MVEEEQVTRRVVTTLPGTAPYGQTAAGEAVTTRTMTRSPSSAELIRRIVVFGFGLVQAIIVLRLLLLLIGAGRSNDLVQAVYSVSAWFVGPFEGIVRTDAIKNGVSVLDFAAIVALVGWTIVELVVIAGINIYRRER